MKIPILLNFTHFSSFNIVLLKFKGHEKKYNKELQTLLPYMVRIFFNNDVFNCFSN